jgi:hypothetical protein
LFHSVTVFVNQACKSLSIRLLNEECIHQRDGMKTTCLYPGMLKGLCKALPSSFQHCPALDF